MSDELTLTQHDQAVRAAIDAMVAWGDACCMKCLAAEAKIDDVVRAAEARGVWLAREQLAAVTEERDTFAKAMELYRDDYYRVRAQRDALVPLVEVVEWARLSWDESAKVDATLAAIRAERTTTTEGGQGNG